MMKRSILVKMLVQTLLPIILVFGIAAFLILNTVQASMTELTTNDLTSKSQLAATQVSEFFTKYSEIARQMSTNTEVVRILQSTTEESLLKTTNFTSLQKTMENIAKTDPENIMYTWIVDLDSSQYVQSNGPSSGINTWEVTKSDWYQQAYNSDDVVITEPYLSTAGDMVVSVVIKVNDMLNRPVGFVALDISTANLNKMMETYTLGETGFFILSSKSGMVMHYPTAEVEGKNITETDASKNLQDALLAENALSLQYSASGKDVYGYVSPVGSTGWMVATGLPTQEFSSAFVRVERQIFVVFAVGLLLLALATTALAAGIIRPLKKLSLASNRIAQGELDVDIAIKTVDETGQVAQSLRATVTRLKDYINYIDEISVVLNQMADGNFECNLTLDYVGEFDKLKQALQNIAASMSKTLGQINTAAQQVSSGSDQVSSGAQALSQGATEQASSIEELSAAIAMITEKINSSACSAQEARAQSEKSADVVAESNRKMQETIVAINEISSTSAEISKIIKSIEDIAFQTNILALNAAVEAARAGEAGKGFAVVADEVRNLAGKSAEAAKNTTALIQKSLKAVENGTQLVGSTASSLHAVVESTRLINALIDTISDAANDQSNSMAQVSMGVDQISAVVQTNSATAEESAAASEELSGQATMMKTLVSQFKLQKTVGDGSGLSYTTSTTTRR